MILNRTWSLLQTLMAVVAVCGAAGLLGMFLPHAALYEGDGWAIDGWVLIAGVGTVCAAAAAAISRRASTVVALLAGIATTVLAALAADPDIQGPFMGLAALLAALVMLISGGMGAWTISVER